MSEPNSEPSTEIEHLAPGLVEAAFVSKAFTTLWKQYQNSDVATLGHVCREAFGFATAVALKSTHPRRTWVLCREARTQEQTHADLQAWGAPAMFYPRAPQGDGPNGLSDPDTQAERISVVSRFSSDAGGDEDPASRILVLCTDSLDELVPSPQDLDSFKKSLELGMKIAVETLLQELESSGYERMPTVAERGQFARRGGIVDVFSWQGEEPLRIEFFDDEIESLRTFDIHTQASVQRLTRAQLLMQQVDATSATTELSTLFAKDDAVILVEPDERDVQAVPGHVTNRITITAGAPPDDDSATEDYSAAIFENPLGIFHAGDFVVQEARRIQFTKQVEEWHREKWRVVMFFHNPGERERFEELVGPQWLAAQRMELTLGLLHRGFTVPAASLAVLTGAEIFGRHQHTRRVRG
jgi:transcription-repair coupling factor (superfamily II helicase)